MSDYHVQIRIKNGRLKRAIADAGYESVAHFCRTNHLTLMTVHKLLHMKMAATTRDGEWNKPALDVATALKVMPDDLFNERQRAAPVSTNTFESFVDVEGLARLSSVGEDQVNARLTVQRLMDAANLPDRTRAVCLAIAQGATLEEVGGEHGVTRERVRQIDSKGRRMMKNAARRLQCGVRDLAR